MVSPTSVPAHSQTRNIQCARRSVAAVPNEMSDARIPGGSSKKNGPCCRRLFSNIMPALTLTLTLNLTRAKHPGQMYGPFFLLDPSLQQKQSGEQWLRCIGADCVSTHFPGVNASLGKACTCARSSFMSYPLLQKLVHETSWLN